MDMYSICNYLGALTTLQSELITSNDPVMPSGEYRSKVAMALFYKVYVYTNYTI